MVKNEQKVEIPLFQLRNIVVNTNSVTITAGLLNELSKKNVKVIFCDEKHNPSFEISSFSGNVNSAGRIIDQSRWKDERKKYVWKKIVEQKITNQRKLLCRLNIEVPDKLLKYETTVLPDDAKNNEGLAARMYFKALFGKNFKRHASDNINAALNYGYALILSSFNRILAIHGYNTALGIKHSSRQNRFNFSCDLMEPFRPIIDEIVYKNSEKELDRDYKRLLIESLQNTAKYSGRKMQLVDVFEVYTSDIIKSLSDNDNKIKELCLG